MFFRAGEGIRESFQRHSRGAGEGEPWPGASPAPRDPYGSALSLARDSLLPVAAAASGGVWCSAFLGLVSWLDPLPGGISQPRCPELF